MHELDRRSFMKTSLSGAGAALAFGPNWSRRLEASDANNGPPQLPANKQIGSIFNSDIDNIFQALSGEKTTPAEYKKAVGHLLDTKPGVLAQNVGMPDPVIYRTKVATIFEKYYNEVVAAVWGAEAAKVDPAAACMKALLDAGTDPLAITIEACRERGVPILASYRMNAEDFSGGTLDFYDFGRQHKNLKIPGAHCLDPAHPEVFQHRMKIFTEVANEYDIDGIEFDFRRWTHMVSKPHENHTVLTRMLRDTRQMLADVAKKKGRKRLYLGARVCPTIAGARVNNTESSCKVIGLDVTTWAQQGLVDYLCPSFFWGHNPGDDPRTAEFVTLAKETNVGIYPTVFPYSKWQTESPEASSIDLDEPDALRRYRDDILNAALKCYAEGADGISTFNWIPHHQPGMTRRNMRKAWGLGAAQLQMHIHPMLRDESILKAYLASDVLLP